MQFLKTVIIFFLLIFIIQTAIAQDHTPKPYEREEFPEWLHDLRRAEIILIGSLPFTMFFALEAFDIGRYFYHNMDYLYQPWPAKPAYGPQYTMEEKVTVVFIAVGFSLIITVADYILCKMFPIEEKKYF
ncbi:MAG: hypothetical protein JW969_03185 [Spirochaetales bacterium]|nr:hypothetical protein [Spirochaetales bacterium]